MNDRPAASLRKAIAGHQFAPDRIVGHNVTEWQSDTFSGTRHEMKLEFEGLDACDRGASFCGIMDEWDGAQSLSPLASLMGASVKNSEAHFWHDGAALDVTVVFILLD